MVLNQSSRLIGALFSTRFFQSMLFGIGARNPFTFTGVILLLGTVAVIASLIPALRTGSVNPIAALRDE